MLAAQTPHDPSVLDPGLDFAGIADDPLIRHQMVKVIRAVGYNHIALNPSKDLRKFDHLL